MTNIIVTKTAKENCLCFEILTHDRIQINSLTYIFKDVYYQHDHKNLFLFKKEKLPI